MSIPRNLSIHADTLNSDGNFTSITDTGNLTFTGTGNRITGDFSNATIANRVEFQSSTLNGNTVVGAIPNGTASTAGFDFFNNSDTTNAGRARINISSAYTSFESSITGTGTYLPMAFYTSGTVKLSIAADTTGTFTFGGTAPRITGDFSSTPTSRVAFQTSTVNGNTNIEVIPNGTATTTALNLESDPALTNGTFFQLGLNGGTDARLTSAIRGTGTYLPMTFYTGGSERMRLDTSGNLGIGTSATSYKLTLQETGGSTFNREYVLRNGDQTNFWRLSQGRNLAATTSGIPTNAAFIVTENGGGYGASAGLVLGTIESAPLISITAGSERMRIDSSGNVNIGSTGNYGGLLSVNRAQTSSIADLLTLRDASAGATFNFQTYGDPAAGTANRFNYSGVYLAFRNSGTEYMRIDSSGNLLVGATTSGGKFTLTGGGQTSYFTQSTSGGYVNSMSAASNAGTFYYINFLEGATSRGAVTSNGVVMLYGGTSDYRLKTVIGAVSGSGNRIDALQPVEYTWNINGERTRGFLAHQFQEVYAGSVSGTKDAVDADGNPVYQSMQAGTSEVIADLVAEIQSLRKRLADAGIA